MFTKYIFMITVLIDSKYLFFFFFFLRLPNDSIAKFSLLQYKYSNLQ
jgi:hypothetical protein